MNTNKTDTREITRVQIAEYLTKDRVLDITDTLSLVARSSQIALSLAEINDNSKSLPTVWYFADTADFKLVCWDILNGVFTEWTNTIRTAAPVEGALIQGAHGGDLCTAQTIAIRKDVKYRQPYVLKIDNGVGEAMESGAVKIVRVTDSLTLLMQERDARKMAQTVLDYVRDWETINFRKRQEWQTVTVLAPMTADGGASDGD